MKHVRFLENIKLDTNLGTLDVVYGQYFAALKVVRVESQPDYSDIYLLDGTKISQVCNEIFEVHGVVPIEIIATPTSTQPVRTEIAGISDDEDYDDGMPEDEK